MTNTYSVYTVLSYF